MEFLPLGEHFEYRNHTLLPRLRFLGRLQAPGDGVSVGFVQSFVEGLRFLVFGQLH